MATTAPSYGTYASAAGSVMQVVGQIYSAMQAARMGEYNAAVAQANAQGQAYQFEIDALQQERLAAIAEQDILLSQEAAAFREAQLRQQAERIEGQATARYAASGVAVTTGSPLYVLDENARQAEMAVLVSNYTASLEQRALREEVTQHTYGATLARFGARERLRIGSDQAGLAQYEGQSAATAGYLGASGSLLQGASRFNYNYGRDQARTAGIVGPSGRSGTFGSSGDSY